jgi:hypothetical protein
LREDCEGPDGYAYGVEEAGFDGVDGEQDDEAVDDDGEEADGLGDCLEDGDEEEEAEGDGEEDVVDDVDCEAEVGVLAEELGGEPEFVFDGVGLVSAEEEEDVADEGEEEDDEDDDGAYAHALVADLHSSLNITRGLYYVVDQITAEGWIMWSLLFYG